MAEFIARLKQRKLVQWALAYIAFAFALLQGVDIVAQRFAWPDQIEKLLILASAIGFCVVLVLAWYHGERGAQRVSGTEIVILALLLAVGGAALWRFEAANPATGSIAAQAPQTPPPAAISGKSVAVLPLSNESGEKDQQYFSDGLSEDLINALSQFGGLKVISRNSSFQFRDSKLSSAEIGRALGVAHLLEGSVQRAGETVRISAALVNAADGSTLWSQHYDRPYKDLFALQDDITRSVADALKARLLDGGSGAAPQSDRPPSGNLDAWNAYARGSFHFALLDPDDERRAIAFYQKAVTLDPRYARAWANLSVAWTVLGATFLSGEQQRQAYVNARAAAGESLRLNANVAAAHGARALLLAWADFDWSGAEAEYRRALELAPNDALSSSGLGRLLGSLGRPDAAISTLRRAIAIDPRNGANWYWLGWHLASIGRFDEAEQAMRKAVALAPDSPFLSAGLAIFQVQRGQTRTALGTAQSIAPGTWHDIALAFALQGGDRTAADAALNNLIAKNADGAAYQIAEVYGVRHEPDKMFEWLDRAWNTRDSGIARLLTDPFILRHKDDPRFTAFCRKVGLPTATDAKAMP